MRRQTGHTVSSESSNMVEETHCKALNLKLSDDILALKPEKSGCGSSLLSSGLRFLNRSRKCHSLTVGLHLAVSKPLLGVLGICDSTSTLGICDVVSEPSGSLLYFFEPLAGTGHFLGEMRTKAVLRGLVWRSTLKEDQKLETCSMCT